MRCLVAKVVFVQILLRCVVLILNMMFTIPMRKSRQERAPDVAYLRLETWRQRQTNKARIGFHPYSASSFCFFLGGAKKTPQAS